MYDFKHNINIFYSEYYNKFLMKKLEFEPYTKLLRRLSQSFILLNIIYSNIQKLKSSVISKKHYLQESQGQILVLKLIR